MTTQLDFINGRLGRLLSSMAIPAIIAMVVNGLYYLADAAFVGWGVGGKGLAGLAIVFPVQMFMIAWGSMLGMGTASIISRRLGEKNSSSARETVSGSIMIAILSGVFMAVVTILFGDSLLCAMGATDATRAPAGEYLAVIAWGFPFIFLYGAGHTERVRGILRMTLAASAGIGIALAVLPLAAPGLVMRAFCNDAAVIAAGMSPLRISLLLLPVIGFQITGFSWFQALGKPGKALLLSLSRQLLFLVPLILILPERFGIRGLWLAFPAADGLAALLSCLLMYSSGREKCLVLSTPWGSQENGKDGII